MSIYAAVVTKNQITLMQGSTYTDTVLVEQSAGVPMNLSTYSVVSRLCDLNGTVVAEFACAIADPASGVISRSLTATATAALLPALGCNYVWGLELSVGDVVLPEIQGGAKVEPQLVTIEAGP